MNRWLEVRNRRPVSLPDTWSWNMERMMKEMLGSFEPFAFSPFKDMGKQELSIKPRGDFYREGDMIIMEFEIPGLDAEKIELKVFKDHMEINALKEQDRKTEKGNYIRSERYYGKITRTIAFPGEIDPDSSKASYDKGILRIEVRETAQIEDNGKKIPIEHSVDK